MYYYIDHTDMNGTFSRHILSIKNDGGVTSFHDIDTNTGPDRQRFIAWLEEGNIPKEWQPGVIDGD